MRFVTFEQGGHPQAGVVIDDRIVSLAEAGFGNVSAVLHGGSEALAKVRDWIACAPAGVPITDVRLCAPIPDPPKILCMGLNYRDHAHEAGLEIPRYPVIFAKYSNTVIGSGEQIVLPKNSRKPDYEAEFAFVIGKRARHINAGGLARVRLRIHELQRRQRARLPDVSVAMDHGQELRHVRTHGSVSGDRR